MLVFSISLALGSVMLETTSNGTNAGRDDAWFDWCGELMKLSLFGGWCSRLVALTSDESGDEDEQQEVDDDGDSSNGSSSPAK